MLIWVILVTLVGSVLTTSLLSLLSNTLTLAGKNVDLMESFYAADGGIEAVLSDLQRGKDPLSPSYVMPAPSLNGYRPIVTVYSAENFVAPAKAYRYLDPGADGGLAHLGGGERYSYTLRVAGRDNLTVNWAFSPDNRDWEIVLYEGTDTSGPLVASASGSSNPGRLDVPGALLGGGLYTVEFHNAGQGIINTEDYNETGADGYTWARVRAYADYIIVSDASPTVLRSYVRQVPGPAFQDEPQAVIVQTWEEGEIPPALTPTASPTPTPVPP